MLFHKTPDLKNKTRRFDIIWSPNLHRPQNANGKKRIVWLKVWPKMMFFARSAPLRGVVRGSSRGRGGGMHNTPWPPPRKTWRVPPRKNLWKERGALPHTPPGPKLWTVLFQLWSKMTARRRDEYDAGVLFWYAYEHLTLLTKKALWDGNGITRLKIHIRCCIWHDILHNYLSVMTLHSLRAKVRLVHPISLSAEKSWSDINTEFVKYGSCQRSISIDNAFSDTEQYFSPA